MGEEFLDVENYDYYDDGFGGIVSFPRGTSKEEVKLALQRRDPDYVRYERDILNNDVMNIPDVKIPTFKEFKTYLKNKNIAKQEKENRSIVDKALGAGEAGLTTLSAIGSGVASPIIYGADALGQTIDSALFNKSTNIQPMEKALMDITQAGTYEPRTTAGQEYVGDILDIFEKSKLEGLIGQNIVGKTFPSSLRGIKNASIKRDGLGVSYTVDKTPDFKPKTPKEKSKSRLVSDMVSLPSGIGGETVKQIFETARKGTKEQNEAFLNAIANKVSGAETAQKAKSALDKMRKEISVEYQGNKQQLIKDKSTISFKEIDDALEKIKNAGKFGDQVIKESTVKILDDITEIVNKWKTLDPKKYHTPEGIDNLKQKIGDYYNSTKPYTDERRVLNEVYGSIGKVLRDNAPIYDDMMSSYEQGQILIREIQDALSLKPNASVDTQFRKLQSIMRDNVNTNFGERFRLAQKLQELDPTLFPEIAGQSTKSYLPQGLQRAVGSGNLALLLNQIFQGGANAGNLGFIPLQMPKVMGYGSYAAGKTAQGIDYFLPKTKEGVRSLLSSTSPVLEQPISYSLFPLLQDQQ